MNRSLNTALATLLAGLGAIALGTGCSRGGEMEAAPAVMDESMVGDRAPGSGAGYNSFGDLGDEAEAAPAEGGARAESPAEAPARTAPGTTAPAPAKRLVYYNGFTQLRVTTPQDTLERAVQIAEDAGGYVESFAGTRVVLRVPVARFRPLFEQFLTLGEVLQKSVTAQDITDAFTSTQLRLKTLTASRDRLIELLARARDEQEKLTILREIKRLTEEIDQLEMRLKTLATLASFSRITIEAVPKQRDVHQQEQEWVAAFGWIRELSPFRRDVAYREDHLELELPTNSGLVSLDDDDHWMAESADGAQVWSHERENSPEGNNAFWLAALKERLSASFGSVESSTVGEFEVLRLVDDGPEAYRYLVAVNAQGDELHVVEVYYPSAEHESRYEAAVRATLENGGS
ncbi:MAG: DUF4349 domain-containing protein [Myxococcota bacterium]